MISSTCSWSRPKENYEYQTASFQTLTFQLSGMAAAAVKQSFPDITKSAEDNRDYRGLELQNGLKVGKSH